MSIVTRSNPYNVNLPWLGGVPVASSDPTWYLDNGTRDNHPASPGNSSPDVADSKPTDKVEHSGKGGSFDWDVGGVKGKEWTKWLDSMGISFQNPKWIKNISQLVYWLTDTVPGQPLGANVLKAIGKAVNHGLNTAIQVAKGGKTLIELPWIVYDAIKSFMPAHNVPEGNQLPGGRTFLGYDSDGHEMWLVP